MSAVFLRLKNAVINVLDTDEEKKLISESSADRKQLKKEFQVFIAEHNSILAMKFWIWLSLFVEVFRAWFGTKEAILSSNGDDELLWYYVALYSIVLLNTLFAISFILLIRKRMNKYYKVFQFCVDIYMLIYLIRGVCFMMLDAAYGIVGFSLIIAFFITGYSLYIRPSSSIVNAILTMLAFYIGAFYIVPMELLDFGMYARISIIAVLSASTSVIRYRSKFKAFLIEKNIFEKNDALEQLNQEVEKNKEKIEKQNRMLKRLSITDDLTGLVNRRGFVNRSDEYISDSIEDKTFITVAAIDIDEFKKINDTIGHAAGDICLVTVSHILKSIDNEKITSYRTGGDEFTVVFAGMSKSEAFLIMNNVLKKVSLLTVKDYNNAITLSVGIYSAIAEEKDSMDTFLEKADKLLYKAKANGKNRIEY